jgi:2-oxoglutarate ferredoxin oxidoreductase subunit alpha
MSKRILMKGNEVLGESAIRAGCRYYFGYPITPQNEVPEYMSKRLPEVGGVFIQAESELASINMVFGAGACGARVMTSSSSPGISLMQEGISYIAAAETPAVIVNMMRGGPGLGGISAAQGDYVQAVKGGGHGDYRTIVLAPSTVQEIADLTVKAFDLSIKYRMPVMILGDAILGQMYEGVVLPEMRDIKDETDWAVGNGRNRSVIKSLYLVPEDSLEKHNKHLQEKYSRIKNEFVEFEKYNLDDADYLIVAYGTTARICKEACSVLKDRGIKSGVFRPISLWPFPENQLNNSLEKIKKVFVIEMAQEQLSIDVKLSINGKREVIGFYKPGSATFKEEEIADFIVSCI